MKINEELLSAYLDGELEAAEVAEVEAALAVDGGLQDQLEALIEADQHAQEEFAALLDEPIPAALLAALDGDSPAAPVETPNPSRLPEPANLPSPPRVGGWMIAAALAGALLIGGAGGLYVGREVAPQAVATAGWIEDIAEYHAVYASQVRHLVEVPAEEAEHIQTWLSATLGAEVTIPDLSAEGLTFQGARLLVAAGKPVAQLLYTDADGAVVALCQIQSDSPQVAARQDTIGGFELVSWGGTDSNFVVVTDEGRADLREIVESASDQV